MRSTAWKVRCSLTVAVPGSGSSCATYPDRRRTLAAEASEPFTKMRPPTEPCLRRPARISSSVVFPAPEGPISPRRAAPSGARLPPT